MTKMKNLLLSALVAAPITASAAGMGIYVPLNITETEKHTFDSDTSSTTYTHTYEYKTSPGFGVAFDSNIGKDKLYNYRLGLEYRSADMDTASSNLDDYGTVTKSTFNIVNTFGFGLLRTETVRLWVGPRLNIQFTGESHSARSEYSRAEFGIGIAPAVGINVNLGNVVSLAADLDYHVAAIAGGKTYSSTSSSKSYTGTNKGLTARFYVLFRFGEKFNTQTQQSNEATIDQSL